MEAVEKIESTVAEVVDDEVVKVRSVVLMGNGSLDFVKVMEWPLSKHCKSDEVRVAVEFCGVNFSDVYHVQGRLLQCPVPYVLGLECAGKVIDIGSAIHDLHVGDRVVCYKPDAGLFREIVVVPRTQCFVIPQEICSKLACSLLANYLTAYFALFEFANLRSGQSVLIHSAAGGVGWAATQLATSVITNVRVFGTASTNKHTEIANNGVNVALTYENYVDDVRGAEVDVIIDNMGGENLKTSVSLLSPLGRVILTGANCVVQKDESKVTQALQSLESSVVPLRDLVMGNKAVCGLHMGTLMKESPYTVLRAVQHIFTLCQQGFIEPRVHAIFPFHKASEAIKALEERQNIGKVLLKIE